MLTTVAGVFIFLYARNQHKIVICPYVGTKKQLVYGNGFAMLGSLVMCTVYTNTFTFDSIEALIVPVAVRTVLPTPSFWGWFLPTFHLSTFPLNGSQFFNEHFPALGNNTLSA